MMSAAVSEGPSRVGCTPTSYFLISCERDRDGLAGQDRLHLHPERSFNQKRVCWDLSNSG